MTIASEITRIKTNIENAYTKAGEKGATMPELLNSEGLAGCIESIPKSEGGGGSGNEYDAPEGYYYITYYDIDGTILYKDMVQAETNYEIPVEYKGKYDPENLVFKGWYHANRCNDLGVYANPVLQNLHLCAIYTPVEEERDRIYITVSEELGDEFTLCGIISRDVSSISDYCPIKYEIDWGDGNIEYIHAEECVGTDVNHQTYKTCLKKHKYTSYGDYIIKLRSYTKTGALGTKPGYVWGMGIILNYNSSASMINKIYEGYSGCSFGTSTDYWWSYTTPYSFNNLELLSPYIEVLSDNSISWNGDRYQSATLLVGNKKLKTMIHGSNNIYSPNSSGTLYIDYVFSPKGLNLCGASSNVKFTFKNYSYLNNNLWGMYNNSYSSSYSTVSTFTPFGSNHDHYLGNIIHYDRHFMFKDDDVLIYINDAENQRLKLFTLTEYLDFIESEEFDDYKDFIYEESYFLGGTPNIPILGNIDSKGPYTAQGLLLHNDDAVIGANSSMGDKQIDSITFNNTRRLQGALTIYPGTITKDNNGEYYSYTQNTFEYLSNIKSLKFHDSFKDIDFYNTNKIRFSYLSSNITELDLRNINFKRYSSGSYTQEANIEMNNNYVGKIFLHEDINRIGSSTSSSNQFFSYSKASVIDISNWEGFDINVFQMFYNCENLTKIIFPENFNIIGQYANDTTPRYSKEIVYNCKNLKEFEVPPQVKMVAGGLIASCTALTKVWLPSTCANIYTNSSYYPFSGCTNKNLVIYTDAPSKLSGWSDDWNKTASSTYAKVYWGATKENYENGDPIPA